MSNAGVQIVHPFDEYPLEDWRRMMAIHADGAFLVARAAFRRRKQSPYFDGVKEWPCRNNPQER